MHSGNQAMHTQQYHGNTNTMHSNNMQGHPQGGNTQSHPQGGQKPPGNGGQKPPGNGGGNGGGGNGGGKNKPPSR